MSAAHWKKWERVKEATTWSTLKFVLNIRDISLAGKWCAQSSCGTANKCIPEATDMRLSWYRRGRLSFVPSSVGKGQETEALAFDKARQKFATKKLSLIKPDTELISEDFRSL
ncbi:hypothetical protein ACFE04_013242 [Oxalis oulophora]